MSVIEKMSIVGIRSFGPEDHNRQIIEFFKPLTLILGPNGSGKTTIIECLRYITTGEVPPNSDKGGSFGHDPKLAGEQEVKGQVKLQFRDVLGRKVIATRSLTVTQTTKRAIFKSLEANITRYNHNNEKTQLSTRCAEICAEMIGSLGVSKAILNNVIFCHQEESNWPLCEGKALKQKFDEIFAATRYIKALEEIRKIRLDKASEVKVFESEVVALMNNKRKAEEYKRELQKMETRLSACKDQVEEIDNKLKPIKEKIKENKVKQNEIGSLQASLESNLDIIKKYETDEMSLRNSIKEFFRGSKEELGEKMQNFNTSVIQKKKQLEKIQKERSDVNRIIQADLKSKAQLLEDMGKLKAEYENHKKRIKHRDYKLRELRKKLGLGDLVMDDDELMDQSQVENVLRNLKQRNNASQNELANCKAKHEANENGIQSNMEKAYVEKAQKQQKLSSSNEQIAKNKKTVREINEELSQLDTLASRQDYIEEELKEAEEDLNRHDGRISVDEYKERISKKQKRKEDIELQLVALNQEMNQLQKECKTRTEIDMITKDINSKQEAIDKVLLRHKETIVHLLNEMPEQNIHEKISKLSDNLSNKIRLLSKDIEKEKSKLSSLETTKRFHEKELESKENLLSEYRNKIVDVCGSQDVDYGVDSLKTNIRELQDEKGALTGSLYLYNQYVTKLNTPRPKCPLCTRSFQSDDEAVAIIRRLQSKIQRVPSSLEEKTKLITDKEKLLNKMIEIKPVKETVMNLTTKEIPELKKKLENVIADIVKSNSSISDMEESLDDLNCDKKTASNIIPDLIGVDQHQREVEKLNRRLLNLKGQIGGKDTSRNIQQVSDEQSALQKEMKTLSHEIDRLQQEVNDYREQLQQLKGRVNELKATKIKMCSDLQKKSSLLEQLDTINKENIQLVDTVKEVKLEISALQSKVEELKKEKAKAVRDKEKELESIRAKIKEEEKESEAVESLSSEIDRYIKDNRERKLIEHEDRLKEVTSEIETKSRDITKLIDKEKELDKDINSQEVLYRDLEDNMKLIEVMEKISQLNIKCQNLKNKIGGFNYRSLLNEMDNLTREENNMIKEKGEIAGRENEMKESIRRLKKELQDNMFKDAAKKHRDKEIELKTTKAACEDLSKYHTALNRAIMSYHKMKMSEINKIIKDLWRSTYAGHDIDYIEIQSDEDDGGGLEKLKRQYNYRVVMFKGDTPTDMRGRCSAGQKVLASLIIRLALAETFCLNCGILALDEPTTNLDSENIANLACALVDIVKSRSEQRNFQLIIITHDATFIERLGRSQTVDYFYKVAKDENSYSTVSKMYISDMS